MDDLFSTFAETSAQAKAAAVLSAAPAASAAKGSTLKRQRDEATAGGATAAAAAAAAAAPAPVAASAIPHYGSGRANLGAAVAAGLEASKFTVDARGGRDGGSSRGLVEHTAARGGVGAQAMDTGQESEEEVAAGAGAGTRAAAAAAAPAAAAAAAATAAPGLGATAAGGALPAPRLVSSEIGEALRPQLTRGEIDAGKSTAPPLGGGGGAGGGSASAPTGPPARVYPFTLDPFQQRAIECLERNESVLVSAHTSAGKTVVAEYAIAMGLRDRQRVIYTSPIKALSNQKYRDFFEEFADVGLMTGDITINPNASVLVMTTEILRSMLYRGSEVMREVKWVVYDEVHYMRDKERGVVWEESIILLPHKVRFVFLSATIPNAREFAEWVSTIHHQTCHVVYTDYRPTPLQHFIFPAGGDGVFLVVDEKGRFREDNFAAAMAVLGSSGLEDAVGEVVGAAGAGKKKNAKAMGRGRGGAGGDLLRIIKMVMERKFDPVIVFSFSKRECEKYALALGKMDFSSGEEKALIEEVFRNAMDSLSEDDKGLPQIEAILPLLLRGIGIHHGGLLPILKEVIEILFQESLLKILFATETFSMGINMPARTVMFTASRKFDGTDFRWISPGEYIQMSGRAGRRGLDDRGIVIQMLDEKMEPGAAKEILKGSTDPLNSAFHLGYNMLLNLLRLEGGDPERLMALSFFQFQLQRAAPALEAAAEAAEAAAAAALEGMAALGAAPAAVAEYAALTGAVAACDAASAAIVAQPQYATPFLQQGRLVKVVELGEAGRSWGWGIVAGSSRRAPPGLTPLSSTAAAAAAGGGGGGGASGTGSAVQTVVDVFLHCMEGGSAAAAAAAASSSSAAATPAAAAAATFIPATPEAIATGRSTLIALPVLLPCIALFSSIRVYMPSKDVKTPAGKAELRESLSEVAKRFPGGLPLLDPLEDMGVSEAGYGELVAQRAALVARAAASPLASHASREVLLAAHARAAQEAAKGVELRARVAGCHALAQRDTLRRMKRVLRRLGHLSPDNVVLMKGRVAAEVNSADELLVTELVFNGVFNELDAAQCAALLSALVYSEKGAGAGEEEGKEPPLREELAAPLRTLQEAARRIASVSGDCKIPLDAEEYVASFNPGMMEMVYAWVKGARFVDIAAMSKEFEGTIIRVIRRLEELTRQLADAAKAIGEEALEAKFKDASAKMRRDIVFAASLYI